jgi:hypothetical protein
MSIAPSPSPPSGVPAVAAAPTPGRLPSSGLSIADCLKDAKLRIDGWTPVKVAAFIARLTDTGSVTKAAAYVRMTTASCYTLRNQPGGEPFAEAWETALSTRHETLADIAVDRARDGVERIRWFRDQKVGVDRIFSDRLLIHMLEATDPMRRRERAMALAVQAAALAAQAPPLPAPATAPASLASGPHDRPVAMLAHDGDVEGAATDMTGDPECPDECGPDCPRDCGANCLAYAALAAEHADDDWLPPDIVATMAAKAARRAARQAEDEAIIAEIDRRTNVALGRSTRIDSG